MDFEKLITFKNNQNRVIIQIKKILNDIILSERRNISHARNMKDLMTIISLNMFDDIEYGAQVAKINVLLEKAYVTGALYAPGGTQPSPQISKLARNNADSFITKLGEDIRKDSFNILREGTQKGSSVNDVVAKLEQVLGVNRSRANAIARTETMRISNLASYVQSIENNQGYYTVDYRAEACELCIDEYAGQTFPIDDTSSFPPLHVNCACVPVYFTNEKGAQDWSDQLQEEKKDIRDKLEDEGKEINPDGTSKNTNN
jgi:SPP1 gp7 family putative phage head morphogenesis protein